jgi:hypothetical protein
MGFSVVPDNPADHEPEPLYLVINCPHCHEAALCPGQLADGSYPMAECPGCDALFVFDIQDVYGHCSKDSGSLAHAALAL